MGASGAGRREDDEEYALPKYLKEKGLFDPDEFTPPPVIGVDW